MLLTPKDYEDFEYIKKALRAMKQRHCPNYYNIDQWDNYKRHLQYMHDVMKEVFDNHQKSSGKLSSAIKGIF